MHDKFRVYRLCFQYVKLMMNHSKIVISYCIPANLKPKAKVFLGNQYLLMANKLACKISSLSR